MDISIFIPKVGYIEHNYGVQGINFSLMDKLNKHFGKVNFCFSVVEDFYEKDAVLASSMGFSVIPDVGVFEIPSGSPLIDKIILQPFKKYDKKFCKKEHIEEIRKVFEKSDVVLDTTGIEFVGYRKHAWHEYARRSFRQLAAKSYGCTYLKYTKSYGPFPGKMYKSFVRKRLNELPFLMVRGSYNLECIEELKLDIPVYSFPDVSLSLEPEPENWAKEFIAEKGIDFSSPLVGISPTFAIANLYASEDNSCGSNHIVLCKKLIEFFQKKGDQILIIPHHLYNGHSEDKCDLALSKKILSEIGDRKNIFLLENMDITYRQTRAIIGCLDFYITGRYHSVCSALYMGVPTVCFSWHIKYKDVLSLFLDEHPILDCRQMSVEESLERALEYYKNQYWFDEDDVMKKRKSVNIEIDKSIDLIVGEIKKRIG